MIDVLGHPIEVGATVLTNGHYTASMNTVSKVEKVTAKAVYTNIYATWYDYKTGELRTGQKLMRRRPNQFIVIDKQLDYNQKNYPENMI